MARLRLENVTKTFRRGDTAVLAVSGVSLAAEPGELLLLMGPSGSGKTTLVQIAAGLIRPDCGKVYLDETEVTALSDQAAWALRHQQVGLIEQVSDLDGTLTVRAHLDQSGGLNQMGRPGRAGESLDCLGLGQVADVPVEQLSTGERQRVVVARALVTNPGVVLADEPMAHMDPMTGQRVIALLAGTARRQNKIVIVASHDPSLQEVADRLVWMEEGHLQPEFRPGD